MGAAGPNDDLTAEALASVLPGRALRAYPAAVSTSADALAWARQGAPAGAVVVADYQAAARGRAGLAWQVTPGEDLAFSLVVHPDLPLEREGWMYTVAMCALADVLGEDSAISWPDELYRGPDRLAGVGVEVEDAETYGWAVVTVLVAGPKVPRPELLARLLKAIESRAEQDPQTVLGAYRPRCATLGRRVSARLLPLGPTAPAVTGQAVDTLEDGALLVETDEGPRVAVRPQNLGILEDA